MNLPAKLPRVVGKGKNALAIAMAYEAINRLIEYCESLTPADGLSTRTNRTKTGTTIEAETVSAATTTEGGEARWA